MKQLPNGKWVTDIECLEMLIKIAENHCDKNVMNTPENVQDSGK